VTKVLLTAAALDLALAALLIGVSGFIFGSGPESMHGGGWLAAAYIAAVLVCVVAPIAGFILNSRGKPALGAAITSVPTAGAVVALTLPTPY
jgi:hypothetical protein